MLEVLSLFLTNRRTCLHEAEVLKKEDYGKALS